MEQRRIDITFTESNFSMLWNALHDREKRLLRVIERYGEDSDEAVVAANDLVYLRLMMDGLRDKVEGVFFPNVFALDDTPDTPSAP